MKLSELEAVLFRNASSFTREEGKLVINKGLVTYFNGKKIETIYHIYGRVRDEARLKELNTHIKINLQKKKLDGAECSCEEYKEFAQNGYSYMCSHITATAYKFLGMLAKNKSEIGEKEEKQPSTDQNRPQWQSNDGGSSGIGRLVRKVSKSDIYYEGQKTAVSDKLTLKPNDLRGFLEDIEDRKIKFKYEYLEFVAPILHKDLPLTFNLKEREGRLVLTTHKKLPQPLNPNNDVYLFRNELYLPSRIQIEKYVPLYERLKLRGEIIYKKDINNYNKLLSLLKSIAKDINISEALRDFASDSRKPEFFVYKEKGKIFCETVINYGTDRINILSSNQGKDLLLRDCKKEEKIIMEIEKLGFVKLQDRFVLEAGDEEIYSLLKRNEHSLHSLGTVILGRGLKDIKIYNSEYIEGTLKDQDGFFNFTYSIRDLDNRELFSAFSDYKSKKKFYRTRNNGFLDLEDEGVKGFFNIFEALNIGESLNDGFAQVEKSKALFLYENIKEGALGFIKGTEILEEIEAKLININKRMIVVPSALRGKLREYQVEGYRWLKTLSELGFGGILADEMGLGKTVQTIALIVSEQSKSALIVCPTSLIYNWKDEIERFAPSLKVGVVHGADRKIVIDQAFQYDVILTTYGTLRLDIDHYDDVIFDFCIIDEAQNIKNPSAQNTSVVKEIKANVRFALTGTPIENNLTELWSIFDFIMPGYLYSKQNFEEKFILGNEDNLKNLKLLIKPFILSRTKAEVIKELPDKIEKKFLVEMTSGQKAVYNSYLKTVRELMKSGTERKIEVFAYLTKLRQICLEPSLLLEEYEGGSGKMKVALELVKNHIEAGCKVLLFSQFTSVLEKIGENLKHEGIEFLRLDGKTRPQERIRLVNEFNTSDNVKVFLISLKAGGTGLNLTSANLVIHFDPWWNPAVEDQASDRAHRIGQKNIVEIIKLVAKGTIEEKILMLQEDKKELIGSIITGELRNSSLVNKLSKEDLVQLFNRP